MAAIQDAIRSIDWNPTATIIAALLGALVAYAIARMQMSQGRRDNAAGYLLNVATALAGMADTFAAGGVPHEAGHELLGLIDGYDAALRKYRKDSVDAEVKQLRQIAYRAKDEDEELARNFLGGAERIGPFVQDLRRLTGDIKAKAARVRAGVSL